MSAKKARATEPKPSAPQDSSASPVQLTQSAPTQEEIALKAYLLWEERGRPFGSAEEDWFRAREQLCA